MHHQQSQPEHHQPLAETNRDDRRDYEPAARKVEVDEDYDDEVEDEKRAGGSGGRGSPQRGMVNGQAKAEVAA